MKDLLARREQAENSFNEFLKQREVKVKEIEEIDVELNRLQGEWRVINDLINKDKPDVGKKADTIDATKVKGA